MLKDTKINIATTTALGGAVIGFGGLALLVCSMGGELSPFTPHPANLKDFSLDPHSQLGKLNISAITLVVVGLVIVVLSMLYLRHLEKHKEQLEEKKLMNPNLLSDSSSSFSSSYPQG